MGHYNRYVVSNMVIKNSQSKLRAQVGVTLVEMMVVVGIIAIVSSIMLFNYSDFSTNVSIRTLSQDVALATRKAQAYATSVRTIDGLSVSSRTFPAYGISFSVDQSGVGGASSDTLPGAKRFILFADIPSAGGRVPDGIYTHVSGTRCGEPMFDSECIESFGITTADRIVGICTSDNDSSTDADPYNCPTSGTVDITYRRPNLDAVITARGRSDRLVSYAKIIFESAKGLRRAVVIWNTGQISVQ